MFPPLPLTPMPPQDHPPQGGQEQPLFPVRLPPWSARAFSLILAAIFLVALIASFVVQAPETVRCDFVLMPAGGADPVQSPLPGVVEKAYVHEGKRVRQGETLFLIRSQEIRHRATELRTLEQDLAGYGQQKLSLQIEWDTQKQADAAEANRLALREKQLTLELQQARVRQRISRERYEASVEIQQSQIRQRESEAAFRNEYAETYKDVVKRMSELKQKGIISDVEFLNHQLESSKAALDADVVRGQLGVAKLRLKQIETDRQKEVAEEKLDIQRIESELRQTQAAIEKLRQEGKKRSAVMAERQRALQTRCGQAQVRIDALRRELRDTEGDLKRVAAPYSGAILRVSRNNPGDVVSRGQELCQIARSDRDLRAELSVPENAVARLRAKQPVRLMLTAFPYQRYGVKRAVLQWVSPAAVATKEGEAFQAFAELIDKSISIAGVAHPLRAGMRGQARVVVGRRTLVDFALEPLRRLKESVADMQSGNDE